MATSQYILSIDLGTGGPKVALVSDDGAIAASALRGVTTNFLGPDAAEQDPEEVWAAIMSAVKEVVRVADVPASAILGMSCTSQYFSIVPIDAAGLPVGPMIPWMDGRGAPHTLSLYQAHPNLATQWIERTGMPPLPTGNDSLSHMLFLKNERPEIYDRAAKLVEPSDYVTARLTGNCVTNACTAFAQLLTDNRRLDQVDYHSELLATSGIDREKLADLVPIGSCQGTLKEDIAREIGLPSSTKVFTGVNDTHAAAMGTGVFRRGHGALNIGTTCQVLAFVDEMKTDLDNWILSMPGPIRGRYMVMSEVGLGGKPLEHFITKVAFAKDALADHSIDDPFANVEKALRSTPAGSGGLLYLPWLSGSQSPHANASMRGGFLNMSLETDRMDMLRSVLEGVSHSLYWVLPAVERFIGEDIEELEFSGGGAVSNVWSQIMADIMNRPVHQLAEPRFVNNRGTALLAFHELGVTSLADFDKNHRIAQTYHPKPENRGMYDRLFEQFKAAWERNRPIFEALNGKESFHAG
ncbi:MAG: FGGY-family carbohydrate kinase [Myxococcales bacterium]